MEFMEKGLIRMMAAVKIIPGKRKEFLDAMRSIHDHKLKEEGITTSDWHEDFQDPNRFYLIEEWEDAEDLNRYCSTDMFRIFLGALKTLCAEADFEYEPLHGEPEKAWCAERFRRNP